jgi:hypothetical protein
MISLCIPVYNMINHVKKLIPILSKCKNSMEIIILDNNSNDGTYEFLTKFDHIFKLKKNKKNIGINGSIRKLIDLSTKKYITFIGADDEITSFKNLKDCSSWANHNKVSLVFTPFEYFNYKKKTIIGKEYKNKIIQDYSLNSPIENYWLDCPNLGSLGSWIFKKEDLVDFNYKKLSKKSLCIELYFALHIYKKKKKIGYFNKIYYCQNLSDNEDQLANSQYKNLNNFRDIFKLLYKNKNSIYFKTLCEQYKKKFLTNLFSLIAYGSGKIEIFRFIKDRKRYLSINFKEFFYILLILIMPRKIIKSLLFLYRSI